MMNFNYIFENAKEVAAHPQVVGKCPFTGVIDKTGRVMYDCSTNCMLYNHNTLHCAFLDMALAAAGSKTSHSATEAEATVNTNRVDYDELNRVCKGGFSQS